MGRAQPTQRAGAEQRPPQVRRATAALSDQASWRALEWRSSRGDHTTFLKRDQRLLRTRDVQLIASLLSERMPSIGPDLGLDTERTEERESSARDSRADQVEV